MERYRVTTAAGLTFRTQTINSVLTSLIERIQERHGSSTPPVSGLATGLADLDAHIGGFEPKELILIASAPQIDRLGVILKFISNFSVEIGIPCALVCARHDEVYLGNRFLCAIGKLPVREASLGILSDDQWSSLSHAIGKMHEAPLSFVSYAGQSLDEMFQQFDQLAKQYGALAAIAIDSLDHLAGDKVKNIQALRNYAKRANSIVIVGCGLERNPDSRPNKRPVLADIGPWAPLNEHIDHVVCVYLDQVYNLDTEEIGVAELLIQGMNNTRSGTVHVSYLPESQSYTNLKQRKLR
jgi:replicative DNA helicase